MLHLTTVHSATNPTYLASSHHSIRLPFCIVSLPPPPHTHHPTPSPGVGIRPDLHGWLLDWLNALDRVLDKKLSNHLVRSKVAAMENAYEFAAGGRVVFSGADTPWEA